jgi:hypothetical protein
MKLIFLTFALVLFLLAAVPWAPPYEPWRLRLVAAGLACWVATQYPFP